jgi:hypothetical protein
MSARLTDRQREALEWLYPMDPQYWIAARNCPVLQGVMVRLEARGLLEHMRDTYGLYYRITPAGRAALEADRSPSPPDAPEAGNQEAGR